MYSSYIVIQIKYHKKSYVDFSLYDQPSPDEWWLVSLGSSNRYKDKSRQESMDKIFCGDKTLYVEF